MLRESLLATWSIFWPALVVAAAVGGTHFFVRWLNRRPVPIPPRIQRERVEPVDFAGEINAYRVARDDEEWAATRPGRVA